jgi:hypothetical protein
MAKQMSLRLRRIRFSVKLDNSTNGADAYGEVV